MMRNRRNAELFLLVIIIILGICGVLYFFNVFNPSAVLIKHRGLSLRRFSLASLSLAISIGAWYRLKKLNF